jgi:hypothetical protein
MKRVFISIFLVLALGMAFVLKATAGAREDNLVYSAADGDLDNVRKLLDLGVDVNAKESKLGCTALIAATQSGHTSVVRLLLARGANPSTPCNALGIEGNTALILAADDGNAEVVRMLIAKGAEVNMKTELGTTALMAATDKLKQGQSTGMDSSFHVTYRPLTPAETKAYTDIVGMLKAAGAQ